MTALRHPSDLTLTCQQQCAVLPQDREAEVVALTAQLGEFRQPALALASAASLWESSETSAVAGQPPRFEPVSASTWAGATTSLSWDDAAAPPGNQLWLADAVHSETLPLANDG